MTEREEWELLDEALGKTTILSEYLEALAGMKMRVDGIWYALSIIAQITSLIESARGVVEGENDADA